jgi:hypothetical protein
MDIQELLYWLVVGILVGGIIILIAGKLIVNIIEVQVGVNKPTGSFIVDVKDCSSYDIESSCISASCKWCAQCNGIESNLWKADRCVSSGTDCGYECMKGRCSAECAIDADCISPNQCDNLCLCRTT